MLLWPRRFIASVDECPRNAPRKVIPIGNLQRDPTRRGSLVISMNKMNDGGTYKVYVLIERFFFFFNRIGKEDSLRVLQFGAIVGENNSLA